MGMLPAHLPSPCWGGGGEGDRFPTEEGGEKAERNDAAGEACAIPGVAAAASEGDLLIDPARESEAPAPAAPEMGIGLALALAFDEEAEKLEFEVALAGLTGFELFVVVVVEVDAPTFEGGG